jgi:hypothetical protein
MIRGEIVRARLGFGVLPIRSCGGEANNKAIGLRRWDGHAEGAFSRRAIGETRLEPIRESVELTPKWQVEGTIHRAPDHRPSWDRPLQVGRTRLRSLVALRSRSVLITQLSLPFWAAL